MNWYKAYKEASKPHPSTHPLFWAQATDEGIDMIERKATPFIKEYAYVKLWESDKLKGIIVKIISSIIAELAIKYEIQMAKMYDILRDELYMPVKNWMDKASYDIPDSEIEMERQVQQVKGIFSLANMKIMPFDEEGDNEELDDDPYVVMDQVEDVFRKSEIRPDRNKKLTRVITIDGVVVGGIYSSLENEGDSYRYSFDIAIHPDWRGKGGYRTIFRLIEEGLKEWKYYQSELGNVYCWVWAVNPQIANILEQKYGFEREDMGGQSILTRYAQSNNYPDDVFAGHMQDLFEAVMSIAHDNISDQDLKMYQNARNVGNHDGIGLLAETIYKRILPAIRRLEEYRRPWMGDPENFTNKFIIGDYLDDEFVIDGIMDLLMGMSLPSSNPIHPLAAEISEMKQLFNI